jgi:hypothetical protein
MSSEHAPGNCGSEHLKPNEVVQLVNDIIQHYQFPERCDFCVMAVLATLVAQVTYHSIESNDRDEYLDNMFKHARDIIAGMELQLEHGNVRN